MVNSRTPTMNSRMKPEVSAGSISGSEDTPLRREPARAGGGGGFLQLLVDLQKARAREPGRGREAVGIGEHQDPDGAVEPDRQR